MQTIIKFTSIADLWQFKAAVQSSNEVILSEEFILIGDFEEAAIELAQRAYDAETIEGVPTTPAYTTQTD